MGSFMVRIDDGLHDELRDAAEVSGSTMADEVRAAIVAHLHRTDGCSHPKLENRTWCVVCGVCGVVL
jgi:hypothetical protein